MFGVFNFSLLLTLDPFALPLPRCSNVLPTVVCTSLPTRLEPPAISSFPSSHSSRLAQTTGIVMRARPSNVAVPAQAGRYARHAHGGGLPSHYDGKSLKGPERRGRWLWRFLALLLTLTGAAFVLLKDGPAAYLATAAATLRGGDLGREEVVEAGVRLENDLEFLR